MERIKNISLLYFFATFIVVLGSFLLSCDKDTPNDNFIETPEDEEQQVDTRTKWVPSYGFEYPQELWDWCITEKQTSGFPASKQYDFSDFTHTVTHLMIFDYWDYNYSDFRYTKLLQKEPLHVLSNGDTSYALSKLSKRILAVKNVKDQYYDHSYDNKIFYTESGSYVCNRIVEMYNKNIFNLAAFDFDSIPDYFWMYLHNTGYPDKTEAVWTDNNSCSLVYNPLSASSESAVVNIYTYFPDTLIPVNTSSSSWCWVYSDDSSMTSAFNSTPFTYTHRVRLMASENNSTSPRTGVIIFTAQDHPKYCVSINVTQAGKPDGNNGGGGDNNGDKDKDWVKVSASGYLPYWYCPTTGKTTPSTLRIDNYVDAFKNTITKAYKIRWVKDYPAHKGYNKITMDKMYHSVYDSQFKYWKQCCDYYYYEVTIHE